MKEQGGHINFIDHPEVKKDTSTTTPLSLVAKTKFNDPWPKGQNSFSNLRWKSYPYPVAVLWDLTKAYHSIFSQCFFLEIVKVLAKQLTE